VVLGLAALASSFVDLDGAILRGVDAFGVEARVNVGRALLTGLWGTSGVLATRSLAGLSVGLLVGGALSAVLGGVVTAGVARRDAQVPWLSPTARDLAPLWLSGLMATLYFRIDMVLLRALSGDADVGYYGAAYRVFEATMLLPATIRAVAFPRLAKRAATDPPWSSLEVRLLVVLALAGVAVGLVTLVVAGPLVEIAFGAPFAPAAALLRALSVTIPVLFINYALTTFMLARRRERAFLALTATLVPLNIGANLVLITHMGAIGAAWSTLVTEVAMSLGCALLLAPRASTR
jgi:O-antigen/teichoic acid export membrane protein